MQAWWRGGDLNNTRGTVSAAGALDAKADGALTNNAGTLVAGGPVKVTAQSLDNSAGAVQSSKADLRLTVRNALQNTHGTMGAGTDLSVQAGSLANLGKGALRGTQDASVSVDGAAVNEGAITAGRHLTLAAQSLDSAKASVLGAGVQADGQLGSSGDLHLSTAQQLAAHGDVVAAGKASLQGAGVDLADSRSHAGEMQITAAQGDVVTQHAVVSATGLLQIDVRASGAQTLRNDAGKLSAGQLVVDASQLSNTQAGEMVQTGAGIARIEVAGDVDNRGGSMGAIEDLDLRAGGAVTNNGGTIAANHALRLDAGTLDNTRGSVAAVKGALNVTTTGLTTNTGGAMQAGQALVSTSNGLVNTEAGRVIGDSLAIDTRGQVLDNRHGTLAATRTAVVDSGAFDNTAGLLQSGGAMRLDTHGQVLSNTDAAGYETKQGGITSAGTLTLATGAIDNSAGSIGAKEDLVAHTGAVVNGNGGLVLGQAALNIDTQGALYDNRGGKTQSIGAMRIDAGAIDNSGSLIRSIASATLNAVTITNADTQGDEQGIEAKNLVLGATTLNNTGGAIRADVDATVRSAGHVDNTGGLISAHNVLRIEDPAADIGARTLQLTNTGGTLVADQALQVEASSLVGKGKITSGKELSLGFSQDLVNEGEISVNGNLRYASAGNVSNHGKLLAGGTLAVSGRNVDNAEAAEMRGDTTIVNAADTVTNRGLIDGRDTQINAHAVVNARTGRIYGDHVSIAADSVLNDGDRSQAGSIAARQRLDIGARTVLNREHALLFSGGDLAIGGALDAERHATGKAELIHNASATIESLGDMKLSAASIRNSNEHLKVERVPVSSVYKEELMPEGWTESRPASAFVIPDGKWIYLKVHPEKYGQRQEAPPAVVTTQNCYGGDAGGCDAPVTTTEPRNSARFSQFGVAPPTQAPEPTPAQFGCSFFFMACPAYEQAKAAWDASYSTALNQLGKAIDAYNAEVKEDNRLQQLARAWTELNYTESVSRDSAGNTSDPAKIVAGGTMTLSGQLINTDSQVLAGGALTTDQTPENYQAKGAEVLSRNGDSIYRYWTHHGGLDGGTKWGHKDTPYTPADSKTTFPLPGWRYEENTDATEHKKPEASGKVLVGDRASNTGTGTASGRGRTFTEVPANVTAPGGAVADGSGAVRGEGPMVVRTSTPDTRAPSASLFRTGNDGRYLVETDPRFAGYRQWLSSDYLFNALGLDPNHTLKRLGDGFYEQKLIREQIAQLTGYRYLEGFGNDEAQYIALMNAGATFAQQYGLRPGIALSAAQMAQLTSDIVWLVEQTVTLPDGSSQRVLVPQVYVRVRPGDIDGSGALLSAKTLTIKGGEDDKGLGDLVNTGTIAGRQLVSIHADNVRNLGGRIVGDSVGIAARNDLDNIGGSIEARNAAVLTAGHDINLRSTTSTQTSAQGSRTNLDRVAGVYVTNPGGTLIASAGHDTNIVGSILASAGTVAVGAGHDVNLGTVATSNTQNITWDEKNYRRTAESAEVGSVVMADGNIRLAAGNDLDIKAAAVGSKTGALIGTASNDIHVRAGESTESVSSASFSEHKGTMSRSSHTRRDDVAESQVLSSRLSGDSVALVAGRDVTLDAAQVHSKGVTSLTAGRDITLSTVDQSRTESHFKEDTRSATGLGKLSGIALGADTVGAKLLNSNAAMGANAVTRTEAIGTTLSAGSVKAVSGRDTTVRGSIIVADDDVTMIAGRDLTIESAQNTRSGNRQSASRASGMIGTRTNPSFGNVKQDEASQGNGVTQSGSQVASLRGDVTLVAGGTYRQTASGVLAAGQAGPLVGGDVNILAKNVVIDEAYNTSDSLTRAHSASTVLGGSASVGGISTNTLREAANTVKAMGDSGGDARMQALGAANLAMQGKQIYDTAAAVAAGGGVGYKVSVNVSRNKSESQSSTQASDAVGSSVVGAKNVNIVATGAGADSNIRAVGSTIAAGDTVNLSADNAITLEASKNSWQQHGTQSNSGTSIGVGFAGGSQNGFTIELGVSRGRGNEDGSDVSYNNTHVSGGKAVNVTSGGDLNLKGAVIEGRKVTADVGGNLNIESLQDTSTQVSKQSSSGLNASLCIPPICYGVSTVGGSVAGAKADGSHASVTEQSGIKAGDGGFDVNVKGRTDLKGGVITSTQAAIDDKKNSFTTASLTTSDIENHSTYKAGGYAASGSVSGALGDQGTASTPADKRAADNAAANARPGGSAGVGSASGSQTSTTRSGISGIAGDESVRTGDSASTGALVKQWDTQKLVKDVQAQSQLTQEFGQRASAEVGIYANKKLDEANALYAQAAAENDPQRKAALYAEADEMGSNWKEGGAYRIAAHAAVGGLTGGAGGAAGAAASSIAVPMIGEQLAEMDIPVPVKQALIMATGAATGAVAGSAVGAAGAFNETSNNYLTANSLRSRDQKIKVCQARGDTSCEVKVQQEYDLKSARNTGELKRSSLVEKQYLEQNRAELEQLLLDPKVSEETRQQARLSIKELNTAINVIDKAPVVRDAAELGLLAVDVATLGEFAAARVLTSSVVKELVLRRTGTALSDDAAARVANNFYRDGAESPQALATSSGTVIQATPGKTTTVLGTYRDDTANIIDKQIGLPKSLGFADPKPGGFNVLNAPDDLFAKLGADEFWEQVNRPFLDAAIARSDDFYLATRPNDAALYRNGQLSGFGREYEYLKANGYAYNASTGSMTRK